MSNQDTSSHRAKPSPEFLTVKQLAARWAVTPRYIHQLISAGKLKVHRFGRIIRISIRVVVFYEAECSVGG